jgi:hypothetical protein
MNVLHALRRGASVLAVAGLAIAAALGTAVPASARPLTHYRNSTATSSRSGATSAARSLRHDLRERRHIYFRILGPGGTSSISEYRTS